MIPAWDGLMSYARICSITAKVTPPPQIRVFAPHTWWGHGKLQLSSLADRPARQVFSWYSKAPTPDLACITL